MLCLYSNTTLTVSCWKIIISYPVLLVSKGLNVGLITDQYGHLFDGLWTWVQKIQTHRRVLVFQRWVATQLWVSSRLL